jgi:hypothetical protein
MAFSRVSYPNTVCISILTHFTDYRHQDDENVASRGSIAMRTAVLKQSPGSNGLRFEIHHTPSRGHQAVQKWYMKTTHPVEASRWVQAVNKNIEWYKHLEERKSGESSLKASSMQGSVYSNLAAGNGTIRRRDNGSGSTAGSAASSIAGDEDASPNFGDAPSRGELLHAEDVDGSLEELEGGDKPPFDSSFGIQGEFVHVQIGLISEYLQQVLKPDAAPANFGESAKQLKESVANVQDILGEYLDMVRQREEWWNTQLRRERHRQDIWEKSLQAVVREGEALEAELKNRTRRKSRMFSGTFDGSTTLKTKPSHLPISGSLFEPRSMAASPDTTSGSATSSHLTGFASAIGSSTSATSTPTGTVSDRQYSLTSSVLIPTADADTDEEDEFFDAIEAGNLPNLVISDAFEARQDRLLLFDTKQYEGFEKLRTNLSLRGDNRPPTSLWSVLKNSIGKDLTRISFPVFFNEPTSMLQRMVRTFFDNVFA